MADAASTARPRSSGFSSASFPARRMLNSPHGHFVQYPKNSHPMLALNIPAALLKSGGEALSHSGLSWREVDGTCRVSDSPPTSHRKTSLTRSPPRMGVADVAGGNATALRGEDKLVCAAHAVPMARDVKGWRSAP